MDSVSFFAYIVIPVLLLGITVFASIYVEQVRRYSWYFAAALGGFIAAGLLFALLFRPDDTQGLIILTQTAVMNDRAALEATGTALAPIVEVVQTFQAEVSTEVQAQLLQLTATASMAP